jgi:uncharacterized protein
MTQRPDSQTSGELAEVLRRYQQAMLDFSASDLAALYTDDATHEFAFFAPGLPPAFHGAAEVLAGYQRMWGHRQVELTDIANTRTYTVVDPPTILGEWTARGTHLATGTAITLKGVLSLEVQAGRIVHTRDYMDVLGLAVQTGRTEQLADSLRGLASS